VYRLRYREKGVRRRETRDIYRRHQPRLQPAVSNPCIYVTARSNQYLLYVFTAISLKVITIIQRFGRPPKHSAISTAPEKECTKFTPLTSVPHQNHIYFRIEMTMIVEEVRVSDNYYHEDRYIRDPLNQRRENEMMQFRNLQI